MPAKPVANTIQACIPRFPTHNALKVLWVDDPNIEDRDVMVAVADKSGLNGTRLLEESDEAAYHAEVERLTHEAVTRQVFGTPFYMYRGEPFWGQDRLDLLEDAITSQRPAVPFKLL